MNIVVLAGGFSVERDVSLSSGSLVCEALRRLGHSAVVVDAFLGCDPGDTDTFFDNTENCPHQVSGEVPDLVALSRERGDSGFGEIGKNVIELCRAADIVYMALHGDNGENGRLQAFFDVLGIKYTGAGYLGSALAMNKAVTKSLLNIQGVRLPRGASYTRGGDTSGAASFGYPCVVKPCCGGSSIGVSIAENREQLDAAMETAFKYENEILVEEFIRGREFSVGILGDRALPPIEIIPNEGFYDYEHKYMAGWTKEVCPADIDEKTAADMQEAALTAFRALRLSVYARGEFILADNGLFCLELNTLPGMTPTSLLPQEAAAAGISYDELCGRIVELSLAKYI